MMTNWLADPIIFVLCSAVYVICLALIDGFFNRLIFREHRKLSHYSEDKQKLYVMWEWQVIAILLLFFLPIALPILLTLTLGGVRYMTAYIIVLLLIPWDMIFGAVVYDNWQADVPSFMLPIIGWVRIPLWKITNARLLGALLLLIGKLKWGI